MNLGGAPGSQNQQMQFNSSFYGQDVGTGASAVSTIQVKPTGQRTAANQHSLHAQGRSGGHGGSNAALMNGQQSKNEIIAKYMKSMNTQNGNHNVGSQSSTGIQKVRQ